MGFKDWLNPYRMKLLEEKRSILKTLQNALARARWGEKRNVLAESRIMSQILLGETLDCLEGIFDGHRVLST
jgi:hypothetical protein